MKFKILSRILRNPNNLVNQSKSTYVDMFPEEKSYKIKIIQSKLKKEEMARAT